MDIMTVREAAEKWGVSDRRVRELIHDGRIAGVNKIGTTYVMPANTQKPPDERITSGKYVGQKRKIKPESASPGQQPND